MLKDVNRHLVGVFTLNMYLTTENEMDGAHHKDQHEKTCGHILEAEVEGIKL